MVMLASSSGAGNEFVAPDPDFERRVRLSFDRQGAMRLIGAELIDVAPGYCAIGLVPRPEVAQQVLMEYVQAFGRQMNLRAA